MDRPEHLPELVNESLRAARLARGWSQLETGRRAGMPQMHISGIETGKIVPRFDTLVELARVLDHDLLMVPRALVPTVQALIRNHAHPDAEDDGERPLYAIEEGEEPGHDED